MDESGSVTSDIDEFTSQLSADDARVLVDLLKLAVANRAGPRAKETLSWLLTALAKFNPAVHLTLYVRHLPLLRENLETWISHSGHSGTKKDNKSGMVTNYSGHGRSFRLRQIMFMGEIECCFRFFIFFLEFMFRFSYIWFSHSRKKSLHTVLSSLIHTTIFLPSFTRRSVRICLVCSQIYNTHILRIEQSQ